MSNPPDSPALDFTPPALPEAWDPNRDLVLFLGRGAGPRVSWMRSQGNQRIRVFLPKGADGSDLLEGTEVVHSGGELVQDILGWQVGTAPLHVVLQRTNDPDITVDFQRELGRRIEDAVSSHHVQSNTVMKQGPTWLRQGLENLGALGQHPSITPLYRQFEGWPAICISPGPSLAKNIGFLREVQDRAVLIAGSHALSLLEKEGVRPHFVVLADAGDLLRHVEGLDTRAPEAFVIGGTCRRENFDLDARRIFGFASNGPVDDWVFSALDEDARLATGGSVACSAASFAIRLGCDPVVLVGQDLAFSGGRFYAEGSLDDSARVAQHPSGRFYLSVPEDFGGPTNPDHEGKPAFTAPQEQVTVPGYHGGEVSTSRVFRVFLTWFEALAEVVAGEVRMLNCTEGGAHIRGMEHLPLAEAAAAFPERATTVGEVIDAALAGVELPERQRRLAREAETVVRALDECEALALRCIDQADRAARDESFLGDLERAEVALKKGLEPLQLLAVYAQREIFEAKAGAAAAKDLNSNLEASKKLYSVVQRAAKDLREPLLGSLAELNGNPT